MTNWIDRAFAGMLMFGAVGHAFGSLTLLPAGSDTQVWSLGSALAAALVAALNWLRVNRPGDKPVLFLALLGSIGWLAVVLLFARSLGTIADFRVIWHGFAALALAGFGLNTLFQKRSSP